MISISVIIPIFNEEKTIQKILEKINEVKINEIKNEANLEIIIINDGSTDNSAKIIDLNSEYFDKFKHLKLSVSRFLV